MAPRRFSSSNLLGLSGFAFSLTLALGGCGGNENKQDNHTGGNATSAGQSGVGGSGATGGSGGTSSGAPSGGASPKGGAPNTGGSVGGASAGASGSGGSGGASSVECTRALLDGLLDSYFAALSAGDPSSLPLAA